ncbi:MAG: DUF2510 domain-containing protein [Coriobacteriia bacterium]
MYFELLRGLKQPLRAQWYAAGLNLVLTGMLGFVVAIMMTMDDWASDYSGGLLGLARALLVVAAFGLLASVSHPWLMLRAVRRLTDDPHEIDAFLASLVAMAIPISVLLPTLGFIGSMLFKDVRFFVGLSLLQAVVIALCWLTPRRRERQERLLRDRGVLVAPVPPIPGGWMSDPLARHELRYWDGEQWTPHVFDGGERGYDQLSRDDRVRLTSASS